MDPSGLLDQLDPLDRQGLQDPDLLYHQGHQGFLDLLGRLAHQDQLVLPDFPDLLDL